MQFEFPRLRIASGTVVCVLILAVLSPAAWACRYNVRDVGFVDRGRSAYYTAEIVDPEATTEPPVTDEQIFDLLRNTNVQYVRLSPSEAVERGLIPESQLPLPRCLLVGSDNRTFDLSDQFAPDGAGREKMIRGVIHSRLRRQLLQNLIDSHSVVLVVAGSDNQAREAAVEATDAAIDRALAARELWDKPIDSAPTRLLVTPNEMRNDPILAWALELDDESDAVQVAVLYGRGRRLGPVLRGAAIKVNQIERKLALVGRDCECELDRRLIENPMIPHLWTNDLATRATKSLGFDPGNPLVVNEVELIMARGGRSAEEGPATVGRPEEDLWGYQEIDLSNIELPTDEVKPAEEKTAAEPIVPRTAFQPPVAGKASAESGPRRLWLAVLLVAVISVAGSLLVVWRRN